jgi:molybdate transport system substrate-binding protein
MTLVRRHVLSGLALSLLSAAIATTTPRAALAQKTEQGTDVVVFAAASLKNALDAANAQWQTDTGKKAVISYAASSALAKQIEQGAPASVFISADLEWMDYLAKKDLIDQASRSNLLGNRLVLIVPKGKASPLEIKKGFDLAKIVGEGRLAVGQVESVPAGKYAKTALTNLGAWDSVAGKLAQTENVRAALALVSREEAAAGIVYQTDTAADKTVEIIGTFPEDSHPPIIYPGALTKGGANPDAASLLNFLKSEKAKPIFEAQGFTVLR